MSWAARPPQPPPPTPVKAAAAEEHLEDVAALNDEREPVETPPAAAEEPKPVGATRQPVDAPDDVPDDGFEIFDELIEVPYRVSPVARVPAGAVLRHGGRAFRVGDATEVVLPSEYINARVDRRTYRWVAAERVAVEARTDGRSVNTGGEALPVGIPIACGIDVSEAGPARSNENYFGGL